MPDIKELLDMIVEERGKKAQAQLQKKQEMEKRRERLKALEGMNEAFQKLTQKEKRYLVSSEESMEILDNSVQKLKECTEACDAAVKSLSSIAERYGRPTINLSVIGKTGAGKSSLLRSASGLGNDCIPAYSGESCTGVTSIIENTDIEGTKANITFKTKKDVLDDFNREVRAAGSELFPNGMSGVELSADELDKKVMESIVRRLERPDNRVPTKELRLFLDKWDEWYEYIGHEEIVLDNTAEIEKFISKHDEKNVHQYYRFIAVKKAVIQTRFHEIIDARIRLLDTVGIGDTAADTEQRMQEAIENESDGVIFIIKDSDHRFGGPLDSNLQVLQKLQDIYDQQRDKAASFWISFVVNAPASIGMENARQFLSFLKKDREDGGYGGEGMLGAGHIQFQRVLDVTKPAEVKAMLNDFLSQISDNLSEVDTRMEEKSISLCQKALELENSLRKQLKQVSINSAAQQERNMIFKSMMANKEKLLKGMMSLEMPGDGGNLLKERLKFVRDLMEEKENSMLEKGKSLDSIIASCCDKDILGDGYRRLAAFEELNGVVRKIGALSPAYHESSEAAFRKGAARCILDFLGSSPASPVRLKTSDGEALSEKSKHFFGELADILFKDIDDSDDMREAFRAMDELRKNDADGLSKAIFNSFSAKYLNTLSADGLQPYTEKTKDTDAHSQPQAADHQAEENSFAFGNWKNAVNAAPAPKAEKTEMSDSFKKKLKQEMKSRLQEIVSRLEKLVEVNEREQFLIEGREQMKAELYNFLLIFSPKYDAKWLMVFQNLYERGMILQDKGKQIRSLSETARKTKSYIREFSSFENA